MRRVHTNDLFRCSKCGTRDTVTLAALDVEKCLCCLEAEHEPGLFIGTLLTRADLELAERGEDRDGKQTRALPNAAQDIVDEAAPRVHALVGKLRGVSRYMPLGDDRDNLLTYIDELSQCATMLTLAAKPRSS